MSQTYSVRKRYGQWAVFSGGNFVFRFETYEEAVSTARGAGRVLANFQPKAFEPLRSRPKSSDELPSRHVATSDHSLA